LEDDGVGRERAWQSVLFSIVETARLLR